MKPVSLLLGVCFVLLCKSAAVPQSLDRNVSFLDSCLLYDARLGSVFALDEEGVPADFCKHVLSGDALFFGCVQSDTAFSTSTSSQADDAGWITESRTMHNRWRVRVDSVIKGPLAAGDCLDLELIRQSSPTRTRFVGVDSQGRRVYEGRIAWGVNGVSQKVPPLRAGFEAIFLVCRYDSLFEPIIIGRQRPECVEAFQRCLAVQK